MQLTQKYLLLATLAVSAVACSGSGMGNSAQQPFGAAANNQCLCPCDGSSGQNNPNNPNAITAIIEGIVSGGPIRNPNIDVSQSATIEQGATTLRPNTGFYLWLNWLSSSAGAHISTSGHRVCLDEGELRWLINYIITNIPQASASSGGSSGGSININFGSGGGFGSGSMSGGGTKPGGNTGSEGSADGGMPGGDDGGNSNSGGGQSGGSWGSNSNGGGSWGSSNNGGGQNQWGGNSNNGGQNQWGGNNNNGGQNQWGGNSNNGGGETQWGGNNNNGGQNHWGGNSNNGGNSGGGSNNGDSSTGLGRGACFKIKDARSGKFWGTYGPEYAVSNSPKVFSVFKAHPVQGGWTFDEVRRQNSAISKTVHIAGKNQLSGNQRGREAVFTLSNAGFGNTCLGVKGEKLERRSDWGGWGDNHRVTSSGQNCIEVELVENAC
ncbi:hypothetical protein HGRIS_001754 [Hohenbuehelia grisea]|uniref:Uncharacterized protein n=1 Tax=Hohenbuehelia grisea TaxID=104357 RepID=A0ABR3JIG5_9AGAR